MATRFYVVPEWKTNIISLPKIGHSSVTQALINEFGTQRTSGALHWQRVLPRNYRRAGYTQYILIRDPLERFKSLWRSKCRDCGSIAGHQGKLHGLTPDELFEYMQQHDNVHWEHVSDYYTPDMLLVPLHELDNWWASLPSKKPMPRLLSTDGEVPMSRRLTEKVEMLFEHDRHIWDTRNDRLRWYD